MLLGHEIVMWLKVIKNSIYLFVVFLLVSEICIAQDDVIRVDTNLVSVPVTVLDRDGRYITNLKKEDFQIFEDGIEQEVSFFEPTEQPFSIHFLIDESSSMFSHNENLSGILRSIFAKLRPFDRVSVSAFFLDTRTLLDQTEVGAIKTPIKVKVRRDADCPSTYLYNAVYKALKQMRKIRGRKVIVLLTDGDGSGFGITAEDTLREAVEQEAMIYAFKFGVYPKLAQAMWSKNTTQKLLKNVWLICVIWRQKRADAVIRSKKLAILNKL